LGPLRGRGRGWAEEEERKWRERTGGPQVTVEPGPLRALLRHCSADLLLTPFPIAGWWILLDERLSNDL